MTKARRAIFGAGVVLAMLVAWVGPAAASDSPAGFYYGTDSSNPLITTPGPIYGNAFQDSRSPYYTTSLGGAYGGYLPVLAQWQALTGCLQPYLSQNPNDGGPANADASDGVGVGEVAVYMLGGPGADPHYNGTTAEAVAWGEAQGNAAVTAANNTTLGGGVYSNVLFGDMESPNWWNNVQSGCAFASSGIPPAVDAATINGFDAAVAAAGYKPGIYSSFSFWNDTTFGCGFNCSSGPGHLASNIYEWTYQTQTPTPSSTTEPSGFCLPAGAGCAGWFGGNGSNPPEGLAWQWAGYGEHNAAGQPAS